MDGSCGLEKKKNQPCAAARNGQVTRRCNVAGKWQKMWRFSTRRSSVKMQNTARWNKVIWSLTREGFDSRSRAQIVLEKARRCFGVAACHREGGVCVYSNKTELAVSEHTDPLPVWRREGATVWPHTLLQRAPFLLRPGDLQFVPKCLEKWFAFSDSLNPFWNQTLSYYWSKATLMICVRVL